MLKRYRMAFAAMLVALVVLPVAAAERVDSLPAVKAYNSGRFEQLLTISRNTFVESIRQPIFLALVVVGVMDMESRIEESMQRSETLAKLYKYHPGAKGKIGQWYEPLAIWENYCAGTVTGGPIETGHYLAEEAPDETLAALLPFLEANAAR